MTKSLILLVCFTFAAIPVLSANTQSGDQDVIVKSVDEFTPGTPAQTPIKFDLMALIERPTDAGYWYLVRANGACNSYGTEYDAQSLSRNWHADLEAQQSQGAY